MLSIPPEEPSPPAAAAAACAEGRPGSAAALRRSPGSAHRALGRGQPRIFPSPRTPPPAGQGRGCRPPLAPLPAALPRRGGAGGRSLSPAGGTPGPRREGTAPPCRLQLATASSPRPPGSAPLTAAAKGPAPAAPPPPARPVGTAPAAAPPPPPACAALPAALPANGALGPQPPRAFLVPRAAPGRETECPCGAPQPPARGSAATAASSSSSSSSPAAGPGGAGPVTPPGGVVPRRRGELRALAGAGPPACAPPWEGREGSGGGALKRGRPPPPPPPSSSRGDTGARAPAVQWSAAPRRERAPPPPFPARPLPGLRGAGREPLPSDTHRPAGPRERPFPLRDGPGGAWGVSLSQLAAHKALDSSGPSFSSASYPAASPLSSEDGAIRFQRYCRSLVEKRKKVFYLNGKEFKLSFTGSKNSEVGPKKASDLRKPSFERVEKSILLGYT
ncbi:uncharacterized protein LOC142045599 [Buteo buteo]|uniref:uncharacterized protein LOC142045599 n=1 Tax=Buteo buteo TaxID=30397 RepID=UPI003EBE4CEB